MSLHLAVDLGAESGRVALGRLEAGRLEVEILHRFANIPVNLNGHLHWDLPTIWLEILEGLKKAPNGVSSLGVDGWGVDYALLGPDDDLVVLPTHYRDSRNLAAYQRVLSKFGRDLIFEESGIQFMPINTLYQIEAQAYTNPKILETSKTFLMLPDLFHFWLSGKKAVEWTNASTTQFANPLTKNWSEKIVEKMGWPRGLFGLPIAPGTVLGPMREEVAREVGQQTTVVAPCTHDTASAVAAVPAEGQNWAYISSGTWSLVGLELPAPVISSETLRLNLTNEGGLDGTTRLLKNVMGLWLLQECRRAWSSQYDYASLSTMAENAQAFRSLINPDDSSFLLPNESAGPMPVRIRDYCQKTRQPLPETEAETARTIYDSLALKYRAVIEMLEKVSRTSVDRVHVVGGGSQNKLLCQLTADISGREVIAGPVEATIIGNLLVTARAVGRLHSDSRSVVRASFATQRFTPRDVPLSEEAYARFKALP